ncbi:MAG: class I SAM-dependent methyltransferase [Candidatus Omnitrophota bacterium]|jgi:SAM-dependent methyltransferase|nr:MAG: class I SAM-dependent methyltransferase [Candidatus Omnitrophota bacterium]
MLEFDAWQRCETIKHFINWRLPDPDGHLLDIGGYPGRMRAMMPQHRWVICDPLVDAAGEQLRGSATALPFADGAFDLAVSLDVLEHIPPEERFAAVEEMVRVSRIGIVISFPYRHPLVEAAERSVCDAYSLLHDGKDHPWLAEHAQRALPDYQAIAEHLASFGGQVGIFDVGSIQRWLYLQMLDLILELLPGSFEFAKELDRYYQEKLYIYEFKPLSYRKILLHLFSEEEPLSLKLVEPNYEEEVTADMEFYREVTLGLLKLMMRKPEPKPVEPPPVEETMEEKVDLSEPVEEETMEVVEASMEEEALAEELFTEPEPEPEVMEEEEPPEEVKQEESHVIPPVFEIDPAPEYVARLEQSLQLWEETYAATLQEMTHAQEWRNRLEQRADFKFYKRMMRLVGSKIEP